MASTVNDLLRATVTAAQNQQAAQEAHKATAAKIAAQRAATAPAGGTTAGPSPAGPARPA